ncbi:unnamed protein product (macronuclear) [Paramecium tetraurelia]|uniref:CCT domain-containing protein n=1 Tax=Paramecium tetraurelia TaxID=5888 RepID=A0BI03_PARTE|nr:uncharacterized protein GSPATT00029206001 [Paramecium tetraurelia]CAK58170.1 unnamed protein product [Paramecium tetraurelia]|eukprot:XP_001425568.1 hypothetical protein (macronuclear) [Paramecium tetraurelia strain d4-2]
MIEQSQFFLIHQLEKQMQYLYNYPQFVDDQGQISQELKNELIKFLGKQSVLNLVLQQQQLLMQKMNVLNSFLISNETQSTVQESKLDSLVVISQGEEKLIDKNFIRKECLQRYRAKKRMWMNRTLYECRKQIADRRLRFNGQFLNCEEEKKIIKIHKILGNHYVRIKNNNIKINGVKKIKHLDKEQILQKIERFMPCEIKKRIQNKQILFKLL